MTPDQAKQIHLLLLAFQRKRGFIRRGYARIDLSMIQGEILSSIETGSAQSVLGLAEHLRVDKSSISRHVQKLYERKLLSIIPSRKDRRIKRIELSQSGKRLLLMLDKLLTQIMEESLSALSEEQVIALAKCLRVLALGLGIEPQKLRPTEHPVTQAILLVSRASGMYTNSFYGTTLSISQLQILSVLNEEVRGEASLALLRSRIPFEKSKISRTISELIRIGAIKKLDSKVDQRKQALALLTNGEQKLQEHFKSAVDQICSAYSKLDDSEVRSFIEILSAATSSPKATQGVLIQSRIEVSVIESSEQKLNARGFFVKTVVSLNKHHELPESILASSSKCFGLYVDQQLKGVAEFSTQRSNYKLVNFAVSPELQNPEINTRFRETCERFLRT